MCSQAQIELADSMGDPPTPYPHIISSKRFTFNEGAFPFMLRCRLGLEHGLKGPRSKCLKTSATSEAERAQGASK